MTGVRPGPGPWFASLGAALLDAPELPEWLPVKTSDYRLRGLFKCAGFAPVGFTKDRGLLVLRRSESEPEPLSEGRANGDSAHPPRRDESGRATTVEMTAASETRPPSESRSGAANSQSVPRP